MISVNLGIGLILYIAYTFLYHNKHGNVTCEYKTNRNYILRILTNHVRADNAGSIKKQYEINSIILLKT